MNCLFKSIAWLDGISRGIYKNYTDMLSYDIAPPATDAYTCAFQAINFAGGYMTTLSA